MNVERKNAKDDLRLYIPEVIGMLKREGKFPAMHVYACTLRSYEKFCAEEKASEKHHCFPVHAGDFHP